MAEINQLFDLMWGALMAIIGLGGGGYGAYMLFEGFTGDQPESKKKGWTTIIIVIVILAVVAQAKGIFAGFLNF